MEGVIRKKICIDKSRSHSTGILPYLLYDDADRSIRFPSPDDADGNWGGFPLDLCLGREKITDPMGDLNDLFPTESETPETGHEEGPAENKIKVKTFEIYDTETDAGKYAQYYRLKYCDIMSRYNEVQKIISDSVLCRAVKKEYTDKKCGVGGKNQKVVLSTAFDKEADAECGRVDGKCVYDFIPIDMSGYTRQDGSTYIPKNDGSVELGKYYMIMPDYETYAKYEDWWNVKIEWIEDTPSSSRPREDFMFCKWVDKEILGKVCVPDDILGLKVPNYVYYTEINNYKAWFENNGVTKDSDLTGKPDAIKNEYHERGGQDFYDFLNSINAKYFTKIERKQVEDEEDMDPSKRSNFDLTYVIPYIAVPITLEDIHEYGGLYETYEYTYDGENDEFAYVCSSFSGYNSASTILTWLEGSALTDVYAESRLSAVIEDDVSEVGDVMGMWRDFTDFNLFQCFYYSGTSSHSGVVPWTVTYSGESWDNCSKIEKRPAADDSDEVSALVVNEDAPYRIIITKKLPHNYTLYGDITTNSENNTSSRTETDITWYEYEWWECIKDSAGKMVPCADGEPVGINENKYRSMTTLGEVEKFANMAEIKNGDYYYFVVKKDNGIVNGAECGEPIETSDGIIRYFEIPYKVGTFHNMQETDEENIYIGDYVSAITVNSNEWKIVYGIGVRALSDNGKIFSVIDKTGCYYEETYPRQTGITKVSLDGFDNVDVHYERILDSNTKIAAHSEEFRVSRKANRAKIVGMSVGHLFDSGCMISAPIFTREGSEAFQDAPKEVADVVIDRGNAAAFEKHFKLSECNSFEDLKNYGNNYYNL